MILCAGYLNIFREGIESTGYNMSVFDGKSVNCNQQKVVYCGISRLEYVDLNYIVQNQPENMTEEILKKLNSMI